MNIIFLGVGNPIPTFIARRIKSLANNGVQITVVLEFGQRCDFKDVIVVHAGGSPSLSQIICAVFQAVLRFRGFLWLLKVRSERAFLARLKWTIKYIHLLSLPKPNLIHLQWLSYCSEFYWLKDYYNCQIISSARGSQVTIYPLTKPGYKEFIHRAIEISDFVHCVSEGIAERCEALGALKPKLIVNYNGIDLSVFKPLESRQPVSGALRLISIGSLIWRKGFFFQLLLLKKLTGAGLDVRLSIVGDGPDRDGLIYTSQQLEISKRVDFYGRVEAAILPDLLQSHDIYISTSAAEGLANSVVEAAACGLPILAFHCEGMNEIIRDSSSGRIFSFGDIDGMTNEIKLLFYQRDKIIEMGRESRKWAESRFDEKYWVARMIEAYHDIQKR